MSAERLLDRFIVVGLVSGFAALLLYLRPYGLIINDEGWYLYSAIRMHQGDLLYRDAFTYYAPLSYHLLSAAFALFGPSILIVHTIWILLLLASIAGIYRIARRLAPPSVAWLPVVAYGLAPGPWHKSSYGLCTVIFFLALARVLEQRTRARILLLGVVAGVTLMTRQELGLTQAALAAFLLGLVPSLESGFGRATLARGVRGVLFTILTIRYRP